MATTFADLQLLVTTITNRPDLVAETDYAIRVATTKAHNSDEYTRDKVVALVTPTVSVETNLFTIDTTAAPFIRFKKLLSMTNSPPTKEYTMTDVSSIFDANGNIEYDNFYLAGNAINLRTLLLEQVRVVYLQKPDLVAATYSSWIADEYPDMIAQGAASIIFDTIGKQDEQKRFNVLFLNSVRELQASYIEAY